MLIRLLCAVSGGNIVFEIGDIVDWRDRDGKSYETAKRFVKAGSAEEIAEKDLGDRKVRRYIEPQPRPQDAWPPKQGVGQKLNADAAEHDRQHARARRAANAISTGGGGF